LMSIHLIFECGIQYLQQSLSSSLSELGPTTTNDWSESPIPLDCASALV
jgi:hypothetical protein